MADALSGTSSAKIEQFTRQSLDERPLKKDTLEKLLSDLLKSGDPEYVNELLFSKRNTEEVSGILSLVDGPEYVESSSTGVILRDLRKLAAGQKILKECNRDWHPSICYPLPRDSVCDMHLPHHLYALYRELEYPVLSGRGIWFDADVASSPDVVSSLSLGGGPEPTLVDQTAKEIVVLKPGTFNGKYVMVFCINAPVLWGSDGCQSFLNLCNELDLYVESDKIKMVMVARMNILADTEEIFKHLFSGFPKSCLAVPYGDWERRERIWKLLKGVSYGIQCSVYNTDGKFLASFCVDDPETPYGAEAFPFDKETLEKKNEERKSLREEGSLEKLLRPYESSKDVFVHDLYRSEEKKRVSEVIKNKHVGLYVCCECDSPLAPLVQKLYEQQCKIKGQEFEIVVLFLPLLSEIDPELVQEKIASLWRQKGIRGWWCLPFNNSVSLRFWGLTRGCDCGFNYDEWKEDKLIIVGSDGKILDMYGAQVIRRRDGFDAFPFTREAVVQKRKMQVKGLTLDSRLVGQLSRGNDPNDTISADMLLSSKKRIVICLGKPRYYDFQGLVSRYEKADRSKFEVVFVAFPPYQSEEEEDEAEEEEEEEEAEEEAEEEEDEAEEEEEEEEEAAAEEEEEEERVEVPWYIYRPHDGNSLGKELKELAFVQSLVGFGDDGRICSLKPLADLAEVGEDDRIHSLKQLDEAGMGERWTWELCLDDTLGNDIHHLFHFDWYAKI